LRTDALRVDVDHIATDLAVGLVERLHRRSVLILDERQDGVSEHLGIYPGWHVKVDGKGLVFDVVRHGGLGLSAL